MKISKETIKSFREDFSKTIKSLEEKYEISIKLGNSNFEENEFRTTMKVSNLEIEGIPAEQYHFEFSAENYGFKKSDYKKEFKINHENFSFIGFKPTPNKNVCLIRSLSSGEIFATSVKTVSKKLIMLKHKPHGNKKQ